ncbi:MAG: class I SAM-dependent methyltransferase, partial [Pseudomonadales bacterium]|nr:class I SAM-dependent methyltransferase [Pseudomonadales bacterium]
LIHFIEADYTDTDVISGLINQVLKRDLHINEQNYEIEFQAIASNSLLLAALPHLFLSDPGLEIFFNQLRFHLLSILLDQGAVDLPLTTAMALRAYNNEYVNYVTPIEDELTRGLFDAIETFGQASGNLDEIESELMVLAMYLPLKDFPPALLKINVRPQFFTGLLFADLFRAMVVFPREEAEFERSLSSIAPISNPVSQLVQGQYESHPYPRWHSTHIRPAPFSYLDAYDHLKPLLENKDIGEGVMSCLVAGCGTGKHPITLAKNFTMVDVVALDLSRASLAYASRLAKQFQVDNIEFIHGDILDVRKIGRQFDVIECVGVLHHMEDPELGLSSLLAVLKPRGLLNIGLYSTLARREIKRLREANRKIGMASTIKNIREFRFELLNQGRSGFLKSKDFYATSSCRDLLFHEQECQFSLPDLAVLFEKHDLRFLGFHSLDEKYLARYRSIYPEDSFLTNLDNWHQFESKYPDTFSKMYQFHCQKAS